MSAPGRSLPLAQVFAYGWFGRLTRANRPLTLPHLGPSQLPRLSETLCVFVDVPDEESTNGTTYRACRIIRAGQAPWSEPRQQELTTQQWPFAGLDHCLFSEGGPAPGDGRGFHLERAAELSPDRFRIFDALSSRMGWFVYAGWAWRYRGS